MCQTRILSSRAGIAVSYCVNCKLIYVWYNNLLLNFSTERFLAFKNAITSLKYEDCSFPFPDEEPRAIISTPHTDISFAFSFKEWKTMIEVMDEAMLMKEVYSII